MAKDKFSRTKACATKTLYAVMKEMSRRGGSMPAKELYPFVNENVELTDWEKEPAGKMKYIRWTNSFQFYSIDYQKATPDEEPNDDTAEKDNGMNLDLLESDAREGIRKFIVSKSPYEFQDMVAALLRAMGYHTPFIAPKGKDGGIDITAYLDPLGAQTPRIKVQVKHKPETAIGASDIRALLGVLRAGDIALFVTSGTFSPDAKTTGTSSREFIRLIDGDEFIDMWLEFYDKMTDDDKNMLPLKRIAFLGNNE